MPNPLLSKTCEGVNGADPCDEPCEWVMVIYGPPPGSPHDVRHYCYVHVERNIGDWMAASSTRQITLTYIQ